MEGKQEPSCLLSPQLLTHQQSTECQWPFRLASVRPGIVGATFFPSLLACYCTPHGGRWPLCLACNVSWAFPPVASANPHTLSQEEVLTSITNMSGPLRCPVEASTPTGRVLGGL